MARKPKRSTWGTITEHKKGVWYLRYPMPPDPETGKRRQGFESFHGTKADASKRLAELQLTYDENMRVKSLTVSRLWKNFYRPYIDRLAPSTIAGYESTYNTHIEPTFGNSPIDKIRKSQVQEWLDEMSFGAAKKAHAVMRAMFSFANDNDFTSSNLMSKRYNLPKRPREKADEQKEMVHDEKTLHKILADCRGESWEAAFILSAFGGARREEAFGAKWENVRFENGYAVVKLENGVQHLNGKAILVPLKTDGSYREIIITGRACERLKELFFEKLGDTWVTEDNGSFVNPDSYAQAYKRWHLNRPYKFISWKNLRNSYATNLRASGVDIATIARLLGHTTPTITYQHYDKTNADKLAKIVRKEKIKAAQR